jgi:hypothetical protein
MNGENRTLREIAVGLIGDGDGFEVKPGLTLVKTIFGGAMVKEGHRDLDAITPDEINAIVRRAAVIDDGYYNPENSPLK